MENVECRKYKKNNDMKAKAFFSNGSTSCRIEITYNNGRRERVAFNSTSELVDYCRDNGVDVLLSDCNVEA